MWTAYSISLAEPVTAVEVDYGDCATFQITCPICHEAVFKVGNADTKRQYFAHYPQSKADIERCERRVAVLSHEDMRAWTVMRRGQTLAEFFKLHQEIQLLFYAKQKPTLAQTVMQRINHIQYRPSFQAFIETYQASLRDGHKQLSAYDCLRFVVKHPEFTRLHGTISQFALERQMRFAADFLEHLVASNSLAAFRFFVAFTLIDQLIDPHITADDDGCTDDYAEIIPQYKGALLQLCNGKDKNFRMLTARHQQIIFNINTGFLLHTLFDRTLPMVLDVIARSPHPPEALFKTLRDL